MTEKVLLGIHFVINAPIDVAIKSADKILDEMRVILELESKVDDAVDDLFARVSHISITRHIT